MLRALSDEHSTHAHGANASVVVLGIGLVRDVVAHTLEVAGLRVLAPDSKEARDGRTIVAVLVEPSAADWTVARELRAEILAIAHTSDGSDDVIDLVVRGADAVMTADCSPVELAEAVSVVASGGSILPATPTRWMLRHLREVDGRWSLTMLTGRELDILLSIGEGDSIKQTARTLGISEKTVQNVQSRLFTKLRARNRSQAISRGHELSLL